MDTQEQLPSRLRGVVIAVVAFIAGLLLAVTYTLAQRAQLESRIRSLAAQRSDLEENVEALERNLARAEREIAAKEAALTEVRSQLQSMQKTLPQFSAELERLRQQLAGAARAETGEAVTSPPSEPPAEAVAPQVLTTPATAPPAVKAVGEDERPAASAGQCTAVTKKGTRCKRNARSNGRCWQHGG